MSSTEQTHLENCIGDAVGHNVRPVVNWLRWLVVCVIMGTSAVVGFVYQTNEGISKAMSILSQHETELHDLRSDVKGHDGSINRIQGRLGIVMSLKNSQPEDER